MRENAHLLKRFALVAVAGLLLVGCGGGSDSSVSSSGDEAATSDTSPDDEESVDTSVVGAAEDSVDDSETSEGDTEADQAAAESALLVLTDFPSGWSEVPGTEDDDASAQAFVDCVGGSGDTLLDIGGENASTGEFTSPSEDAVEHTVSVVPDEATAVDFMDRFGASGVDVCFRDGYQALFEELAEDDDSLPDDFSVGEVTVGRLNLTPVGDKLVAYRVTVPLSAGGSEIEVYFDVVAVRSGRSVAGLSFAAEFSPFFAEDLDKYVGIAASRLPGGTDGTSSSDPADPSTDVLDLGTSVDFADWNIGIVDVTSDDGIVPYEPEAGVEYAGFRVVLTGTYAGEGESGISIDFSIRHVGTDSRVYADFDSYVADGEPLADGPLVVAGGTQTIEFSLAVPTTALGGGIISLESWSGTADGPSWDAGI